MLPRILIIRALVSAAFSLPYISPSLRPIPCHLVAQLNRPRILLQRPQPQPDAHSDAYRTQIALRRLTSQSSNNRAPPHKLAVTRTCRRCNGGPVPHPGGRPFVNARRSCCWYGTSSNPSLRYQHRLTPSSRTSIPKGNNPLAQKRDSTLFEIPT